MTEEFLHDLLGFFLLKKKKKKKNMIRNCCESLFGDVYINTM